MNAQIQFNIFLALFGQFWSPVFVSPWCKKIPLIIPYTWAFYPNSTNTLYGWFPYKAAIFLSQSAVVER